MSGGGVDFRAAAHQIRQVTREHGEAAAEIHAGLRRRRVDPRIAAGMAGAAMALTGGDAWKALFANDARPSESDEELVAVADGLRTELAEVHEAACRINNDAVTAHEQAERAKQAAISEWRAAQARCASAGDRQAAAAAEADMDHAARKIDAAVVRLGELEQALDLLRTDIFRLRHALRCVRRVEPDLDHVYRPLYELRGWIPGQDDDWLTTAGLCPVEERNSL